MTCRRIARRLGALVAVLSSLAVQGATAFAAAGGGSGGFGGGGGGGGGGGSGFGGGSGGGGEGGDIGVIPAIAIFGGVAAVIAFSVRQQKRNATWSRAYASTRDRLSAARRRSRAQEVEGTAVIAAADDPAFAGDRVRRDAAALFAAIQGAWDLDDRDALATMLGPDLMTEWRLRLEDFARKGWRNRVSVRSSEIEYVGITNRAGDPEDRVVVRVSALLDDLVVDGSGERIYHDGNTSGETHLREYWTLGKRDGSWALLSIEQDEEGAHQLEAPLEADPAEDARLTDRIRVEAAVADALPAGVHPSHVDDDDALSADAKARDLALADGRFDPDIIEAAVRRAVAAWAEAVDGDDAAFAHLSHPGLLKELLHPPSPGRSLRLVLRAPEVTSVVLTALDTDSTPATASVHMGLRSVRYVEDRDTLDVVAGSKERATRFDGTWTLALDGPPDAPWRVSAVRDDPPAPGD